VSGVYSVLGITSTNLDIFRHISNILTKTILLGHERAKEIDIIDIGL